MTPPTSKGVEPFWLKAKEAQEVKRMNTLVDQLDGYRLQSFEKRSIIFLGKAPSQGRPRGIYK